MGDRKSPIPITLAIGLCIYIACTTVQAVINGTLQTVIYCTPLNQAPHTGVSVLLIMQSRTICQKFEMTYVLETKLPEYLNIK